MDGFFIHTTPQGDTYLCDYRSGEAVKVNTRPLRCSSHRPARQQDFSGIVARQPSRRPSLRRPDINQPSNTNIMKQTYCKPEVQVFHTRIEHGYQLSHQESDERPSVDTGSIEGIVDGGAVYF